VHKGTRAVGNVGPDTEITLQFGAKEHDDEGERPGGPGGPGGPGRVPLVCTVSLQTEYVAKYLMKFTLSNSIIEKRRAVPQNPLESCLWIDLLPSASALGAGSRVAIQLQVRYRQRKGETMLRVITACRDVTDDR